MARQTNSIDYMKPQENKTELRPETTRLLILALIALLGLAPLLLYWFRLGSAPQITPARARELLLEQNEDVRLIDVRPTEVGRRRSIDGSSHWGGTDILEITDADEVPGHLQDTTLLLICDNGILGAKATKHLRRLGVDNAFNVRGGIQDWIGTADSLEGAEFGRFITPTGGSEFPFRHSPLFEQLAMVICAFAIKPAYVLLSFILIVILRKSGSVDLVALRWGMIFFFLGENFCTLNYYLFNETSYLFEYLHSFGMLLCSGFVIYAAVEGFDRRVLMLSAPEKKCAALDLCSQCVKYTQAPCAMKRTFYLIIPACIALALMLPTADLREASYNTYIFKTFYHYNHSLVHQLYETRFLPVAAILILTIALIALICAKQHGMDLARIFFAAGAAALTFGFLRMILLGSYSENLLWFAFWEEATELIFIAGVCYILWLFRKGLFPKPAGT